MLRIKHLNTKSYKKVSNMIFEADCHLLNYDKHHNKIYEADSKKTRRSPRSFGVKSCGVKLYKSIKLKFSLAKELIIP